MPFIEINGFQMYYELFGQDHRDQSPILLIHGSTQTGHSCWNLAAQLLARDYRVIVPDCRGHGQSTNPHLSYSFKELAQDCADLIVALGYPQAHIIGHSNGGNVALVTLMEHPEVVKSAILQAANAFVSPDLVEKEPTIFDPARVERDAPQWMEEMIRLHGPTHGQYYWRQLLQLTVAEIITEPRYSAQDLSGVDKPVLVIQGENDRVNAPARHAQFIAQNIPLAEMWIVKGVGHNVHDECLCEWVKRVTAFLQRRGSAVNEAIYQLQNDRFADTRITVFDVQAVQDDPDDRLRIHLNGKVLSQEQADLAVSSVLPFYPGVASHLEILLNDETPWALVRRPVTDLRKAPGNTAERVSQAIIGESVRVLEQKDNWSWVQMTQDNYLGWLHSAALTLVDEEQALNYRRSINARVLADLLPAFNYSNNADNNLAEELSTKLPFCAALVVLEWFEDKALVRLPDGKLCLVPRSGLIPLKDCPTTDMQGKLFALQQIQRFIGVPYLWGGRTPFGYDCSGLVQTYYQFMNVQIPRDADQQYQAGEPVVGEFQAGDLLFFGESNGGGHGADRVANISHVAISLGGSELIHANGTAWGISYNSLHPDSPKYLPWLHDNLVGVRRFS